ncbi:MFS general substrate transporter [Penicillium diatomitis]|uniref:MFS general substrate transporter n=1 Tax=Penicillium diatomitis TaxID=2819901 RepID=A0A9W9XE53_9EURO|nr:MFS general substrate transporter [Penicillium diatomitis]KAJ5489571.1 MFS general substrate transporter [Penicillium diatomitis]
MFNIADSHPLLHMVHVYMSIAILFTNYFLAQYDKFILSYFQASVLKSLSLTGTQYALLSGYSTGIVYALLALPVAFVADFTSARVWTLSIASLWWSLCVIFQGLAKDFADIYCARLGMGIGQAAVEALSVSLISDLVGWRNVFIGESVLYVGVYVGEAISGQIATSFSKTGTSWQVAMRAIGITGIVVSVLLRLVLREPTRASPIREQEHEEREFAESVENGPDRKESSLVLSSLTTTLSFLIRLRSFWPLVLSAGLRQLAGNVFGYYMPGYLSSVYDTVPDLLSRYGIIVGTVGSASVIAGGLLTSLLWHRTKLTPIYLTTIGGFLSSIFVLLMIFSKDVAAGDEQVGVKILYATMSAAYLTAETWLGCMSAMIALLLLPEYKTFGLAIWSSIQVLIYSSGPEIIGLAVRNLDPGSAEYTKIIKICLAVIIPVGYWGCGLGMLLSIPLVRKDLKDQTLLVPASPSRKIAIGALVSVLVVLVIILFVLSLVYSV